MKYTEDEEQYGTNCFPIYPRKDKVDEDQNILLDNLQSAIDTIDDRIGELEQQLVSDYNNLTGLVNQTGIEISTTTSQIVNNLRDELTTLEGNLAQIVVTDKVKSDEVETELANITEADIGEANIGNLKATNATIDLATIEHSVQSLIEATRIVVDTLEADTIQFDTLEATVAEITSLKSDSSEIKELLAESIETDLIMGSQTRFFQPNTFPQNDELLVINVPAYNGEVKLTELHGLFSVSVINNGLVAYGSPDGLVYAVTFDDFGTHIYFDSVGRTISYNEIHIGEKDFESSTSEIVDKIAVETNTPERFGAVSRSPLDVRTDNGWNVVVVEELPEHPVNNTMYVIEGVGAIYYTDDTAYPITYVFILDYEQDDDNPIRMNWDIDTSTLSVSVSYEDSENSDINFDFIEQ